MKNKILTWDEYFMSLSHLSGKRSKDPSTQVGACIVNQNKRIVGIVHAELNAILNSTAPLKNCSIYVSLFPCNECAKAIIQSGITEVVYESDKYAYSDSVKASKRMLESAGVELRQIKAVNVVVQMT